MNTALKIVVMISFLAFTACSSVQTTHTTEAPAPNSANALNPGAVPDSLKPPEFSSPDAQKLDSVLQVPALPVTPGAPVEGDGTPAVGIVLGPGALHAFAHIGVLEEFAKAKLPVRAVVGIETGALVAAIYAHKAQMFDVEWQMLKMHEDEWLKKSLFGDYRAQSVQTQKHFWQTVFATSAIEDSKLTFGCPVFDQKSKQTYIVTKGLVTDALGYCMPYGPLFEPTDDKIAAVTALGAAVQFLKQHGATYLVYVDVLSDSGPSLFPNDKIFATSETSWQEVKTSDSAQYSAFNKVITVSLRNISLNDFNHRREVIQRGHKAGAVATKEITTEMGL